MPVLCKTVEFPLQLTLKCRDKCVAKSKINSDHSCKKKKTPEEGNTCVRFLWLSLYYVIFVVVVVVVCDQHKSAQLQEGGV